MINLSEFENPIENVFIYRKWNWDYSEAEKFQMSCVSYVQKNPSVSILIVCSHPSCFTIGKGLQPLKNSNVKLVDFEHGTKLKYPLKNIKRGGGITFHHPGQVVVYPIFNLNFLKISTLDLMMGILSKVGCIIEREFGLKTIARSDLLGLWAEVNGIEYKIASMGLALDRFTTYHGLALNLSHDSEMFSEIARIHPCGLPGNLYSSIEKLKDVKISDKMRDDFIAKIITQNLI